MDKVLVQDKVYPLLNETYVAIKIDLDSERSLARKYRVGGIPALLFFDRQGNLQRLSGSDRASRWQCPSPGRGAPC